MNKVIKRVAKKRHPVSTAQQAPADVLFQRALALDKPGARPEELEEAYGLVLEVDPNSSGALVNIGTLATKQHKWQKARNHFEQAIEIDPNYAMAHYNLATTYEELGMFDKAVPHYETALRLNPDFNDAHYNFALLCSRIGETLKAVKHWERYLSLDTDQASQWHKKARDELAKLLPKVSPINLTDVRQAQIETCKAAVTKNPRDIDAHLALIEGYCMAANEVATPEDARMCRLKAAWLCREYLRESPDLLGGTNERFLKKWKDIVRESSTPRPSG